MMDTNRITVEDVVAFLYDPRRSKEERERIARAFNDSARVARTEKARSFMLGDKVSFQVKGGLTLVGTVLKINRATVKVDVPGKLHGSVVYTCSPSGLTHV